MVDIRIRELQAELKNNTINNNDYCVVDQIEATLGATGKAKILEFEKNLEKINMDKRSIQSLTVDSQGDLVINTKYYTNTGVYVNLTVDRVFHSFDNLSLDFQYKVGATLTIDGKSGIPVYTTSNISYGNFTTEEINRNCIASGLNYWYYYAPTTEFPNGRVYYKNSVFETSVVYFLNTPADYLAGFLRLNQTTNGLSNFNPNDFPNYVGVYVRDDIGNGTWTTVNLNARTIAEPDGKDIVEYWQNNGKSESWGLSLNSNVLYKYFGNRDYPNGSFINFEENSIPNFYKTDNISFKTGVQTIQNASLGDYGPYAFFNILRFNYYNAVGEPLEPNFKNKPASIGLKPFLKI